MSIIHRDDPPATFDTDTGVMVCEDGRPTAPYLMDIKVTDECHANCPFCYQSSGPEGGHASMPKLIELLSTLRHYPFQIAIGGGEPTEWPWLYEFCEWCRGHGIVPNTSVGPCADRQRLSKVVPLMGAVGVSFNHRRDGAEENVRVIKQAGGKVHVHYVVSRESVRWVTKFIGSGYCGLPVDAFVFLSWKPVGRADGLDDGPASKTALEGLFRACRKAGAPFGVDGCLGPFARSSQRIPAVVACECDGGSDSMYLDAVAMRYGTCSFLPTVPATDLGAAWTAMEHMKCKYEAVF